MPFSLEITRGGKGTGDFLPQLWRWSKGRRVQSPRLLEGCASPREVIRGVDRIDLETGPAPMQSFPGAPDLEHSAAWPTREGKPPSTQVYAWPPAAPLRPVLSAMGCRTGR